MGSGRQVGLPRLLRKTDYSSAPLSGRSGPNGLPTVQWLGVQWLGVQRSGVQWLDVQWLGVQWLDAQWLDAQ